MYKPYFMLAFVFTCLVVIALIVNFNTSETLVFASIVLRHGHKSPTYYHTYNNDPNVEETFKIYPPGALTNEGNYFMKGVGDYLRRRYEPFLKAEPPGITVKSLSSDLLRTKESLLAVLSCWFPMKDPSTWKPAGYDVVEFEKDDILAFWGKCTEYETFLEMLYENDEEVKAFDLKHKMDYDYIAEHTGENITSLYSFDDLYFTLKIQESMGIILPNWTKAVYPEIMAEMSLQSWKTKVSHPQSIRYSAGRILQEINKSFQNKIFYRPPDDLKISIYMGHDYSIASLLKAFDIESNYHMAYGSYFIFELHEISGAFGVKTFFQDHTGKEAMVVQVNNCTTFCPISEFTKLTEIYFPNPNVCLDEEGLNELFVGQ